MVVTIISSLEGTLLPGDVRSASGAGFVDKLPKVTHWFALDESRPLFAFAGIWRPWTGTRGTKAAPVDGEHLLFSFLTCEANETVRPIHAKALPAILTTPQECDAWLSAPADQALTLQRPLPAGALKVVATGEKTDPGAREAETRVAPGIPSSPFLDAGVAQHLARRAFVGLVAADRLERPRRQGRRTRRPLEVDVARPAAASIRMARASERAVGREIRQQLGKANLRSVLGRQPRQPEGARSSAAVAGDPHHDEWEEGQHVAVAGVIHDQANENGIGTWSSGNPSGPAALGMGHEDGEVRMPEADFAANAAAIIGLLIAVGITALAAGRSHQ